MTTTEGGTEMDEFEFEQLRNTPDDTPGLDKLKCESGFYHYLIEHGLADTPELPF